MNVLMADDGSFYCNIQGAAEGTNYHIIYKDSDERDFQPEIEQLFLDFEISLSVYDDNSIISRINRNEEVEIDDYFHTVFIKAKEISLFTGGAFDISAEPLFRAWGFSSREKCPPAPGQIEELKKYIGMDKVRLEGKHIVKDHPSVVLNVNAIAKGYSADVMASFLEKQGCVNYLVEVGGEIRLKGKNLQGEDWRVGIDRPSEDNPIPGQNLQAILQISDKGIATSGNYRQFYIEEDQKISHTINPSTGYPSGNNLLSVTVVADDTLTADAYATAFLVSGIEKSLEWINVRPELDAIFICDENGEYKMYCTSRLENRIVQE